MCNIDSQYRSRSLLTRVLVVLTPAATIPTFPPFTFPYLYQRHVPCYHLPELFGCIHLANISLQEDMTTSLRI